VSDEDGGEGSEDRTLCLAGKGLREQAAAERERLRHGVGATDERFHAMICERCGKRFAGFEGLPAGFAAERF